MITAPTFAPHTVAVGLMPRSGTRLDKQKITLAFSNEQRGTELSTMKTDHRVRPE